MRPFSLMQHDARLNRFEFPAASTGVVAVAAGLIVRSRLPAIPLTDGDSWGYLCPALCWLSGVGFQQTDGRDWLYPALLTGILKIGGDFSAVTFVQHFLGLLGILFGCVAWYLCTRLLPPQRPHWRGISSGLALLLLAFYALSPQQALLENTIRPEGMLAFFQMVYFCCLISFFGARWRLRQTGAAIGFGCATIGMSYVILLLKPSWGFAFGASLVCVIAGIFGKTDRAVRFGPLLAGAIPVVLLGFTPNLLGFRKDTASELFLPFTLVSIHAAQILETNPDREPSDARPVDETKPVLYEQLSKVFPVAKADPGRYKSLGFDSDYIQYHSRCFTVLGAAKRWNSRELAATCYSAYFHAWLRAPGLMLQKIANQLKIFVFPKAGDFYSAAKNVDFRHEALVSRRFLPDCLRSTSVENIYQSYLHRLESTSHQPGRPIGFPILATLALFLAWSASWLQLAFAAAVVFVCSNRRSLEWRLPSFTILAVLAGTYGMVLTIAWVHSLDVIRYRVSYAPALLLGLALIINWLASLGSVYFDIDLRPWRARVGQQDPTLSPATQRLADRRSDSSG
jgi:hypothetical protein